MHTLTSAFIFNDLSILFRELNAASDRCKCTNLSPQVNPYGLNG